MELRDTIDLMTSSDYKDRFMAEYLQLKIRYYKLSDLLNKWQQNKLDFAPSCTYALLQTQLEKMWDYLNVLEVRAAVEGIDLTNND